MIRASIFLYFSTQKVLYCKLITIQFLDLNFYILTVWGEYKRVKKNHLNNGMSYE